MKELIASIWLSIGSLLGVAPEEPQKAQEEPKAEQQVSVREETEKPTEAPKEKEKKPLEANIKEVSQNDVTYEAPKDAPWLTPVAGADTISEKKTQGEQGEVTTIVGNNTKGQTETQMDGPRKLQIDSMGNIWFVDGHQGNAKLRMYDGTKINMMMDLVNNKLTDAQGHFLSAGLAIIHDNVYVFSTDEAYKYNNGRLEILDPKIRQYMKNNQMEYIYRGREYKDSLYFMFVGKSRKYMIAKYDITNREITQVTDAKPYANPYNFYVHNDNEIMISTELGYVVWETINPRKTQQIYFGDSRFKVVDVWVSDNRNLYMVTWEDQAWAKIYMDPQGNGFDDTQVIAGSRRGFVDGFKDEVEMDTPIDFVWDGSGYIFADTGNNAIRKLWWAEPPSDKE